DDVSPTLKNGGATVSDYELCKKAYRKELTPNMFCAGTQEGTPAPCHGDSGRPYLSELR
ncbi:unnamed protein product, partial [Candidula unifasciata]